MGLVVVLSVAMGLVLVGAGLVVGGMLGGSLVVLGDHAAGAAVAGRLAARLLRRRSRGAAFVNDPIWTLVLFPGFLVLGAVGLHASLFAILLLWGIWGLVAAVVGIVQSRVVPDVTRARSWWREHRDIGPRYLASELLPLAATQGVIYVLGVVAGLAAAGSLRAAQLVLGPLNILTMSVYFVAVPVGARMYAERSSRLRGAAAGVSLLMVSATLVLTIAILAFPDGLGPFLLGESWPGAELVFLPVAVAAIGKNIGYGPRTGLLAMAMARRTLRLTSIESGLAVAVGSVGAVLAAASGAAWGLAVVSCAVAVVWWREFGVGLRGPVPARGATTAVSPPAAPDSTIA